jgi:hypothetical protein
MLPPKQAQSTSNSGLQFSSYHRKNSAPFGFIKPGIVPIACRKEGGENTDGCLMPDIERTTAHPFSINEIQCFSSHAMVVP